MKVTTVSPQAGNSPAVEENRRSPLVRLLGPALVLLLVGLAVGRTVWVERFSAANDTEQSGTLEALRAEAERDPGSPEAWIGYGNAALREAVATGEKNVYFAARDAFDEAMRVAPDSVDAVAARAGYALNAHDFAGALTLASRAVELNAAHPAALAALVDAQVETGRLDEAAMTLERLLNVDPSAAAYARVSYIRELRGDLDGARVAMQQAVAKSSAGEDRASLLGFLGDLQLQSGRLDQADDAYRRALIDNSTSAAATVGRARVLVARGMFADAVRELDRALTMGPETTAAIVRGEVALLMGDDAAAQKAFRTANERDDRLRDRGENTDLESASFLAARGDLVEAQKRATDVYAVRASVVGADAVAWTSFKAGDLARSRSMVDRALATGVRTPTIRLHAAVILAAAGEAERGKQELAVAFSAAPWGDLSILSEAEALATRLGVALPPSWVVPGAR
jgi:tetratricopeptide (TPR) repeat protein